MSINKFDTQKKILHHFEGFKNGNNRGYNIIGSHVLGLAMIYCQKLENGNPFMSLTVACAGGLTKGFDGKELQ